MPTQRALPMTTTGPPDAYAPLKKSVIEHLIFTIFTQYWLKSNDTKDETALTKKILLGGGNEDLRRRCTNWRLLSCILKIEWRHD